MGVAPGQTWALLGQLQLAGPWFSLGMGQFQPACGAHTPPGAWAGWAWIPGPAGESGSPQPGAQLQRARCQAAEGAQERVLLARGWLLLLELSRQ